jgi:hypothetical protein
MGIVVKIHVPIHVFTHSTISFVLAILMIIQCSFVVRNRRKSAMVKKHKQGFENYRKNLKETIMPKICEPMAPEVPTRVQEKLCCDFTFLSGGRALFTHKIRNTTVFTYYTVEIVLWATARQIYSSILLQTA